MRKSAVIARPDSTLVEARRGGRQSSLLRPRLSFMPELLKSVEVH